MYLGDFFICYVKLVSKATIEHRLVAIFNSQTFLIDQLWFLYSF